MIFCGCSCLVRVPLLLLSSLLAQMQLLICWPSTQKSAANSSLCWSALAAIISRISHLEIYVASFPQDMLAVIICCLQVLVA